MMTEGSAQVQCHRPGHKHTLNTRQPAGTPRGPGGPGGPGSLWGSGGKGTQEPLPHPYFSTSFLLTSCVSRVPC